MAGLPLLKRLTADRDEERHWRAVADGKAMVARRLRSARVRVASSCTACRAPDDAEIDHLLIGPGGVFAVNSSLRADQAVCLGADTMIVDGKRVHHIQHEPAARPHARAGCSPTQSVSRSRSPAWC